jgi:hypothetical protein
VDVRDIDQYGRLVSTITLDGRDLSVALVRAGLAWHYTQYSKESALAAAEKQARTDRIGVWSQATPIAPSAFRRPAAQPRQPAVAIAAMPRPSSRVVYHGNSDSRVLHAPACQHHYDCQHCTILLTSVAEAQARGLRLHSGPGGCID